MALMCLVLLDSPVVAKVHPTQKVLEDELGSKLMSQDSTKRQVNPSTELPEWVTGQHKPHQSILRRPD